MRVCWYSVIGKRFELAFLATSCVPEMWQVVDKRLQGYYTIQYMERGAVALAYDERKYELEGSWFWPAYPGPRTRFTSLRSRERWHHRHVGFHGAVVGEWLDLGLWPDGPQAVDSDDFAPRMDELIALVRSGREADRRRAINRLEAILLDLAAERQASATRAPWLSVVLEGIESRPFDTDFDRLADRVGMAPSTLRRRFRAAMGCSLHDHAIATRLVRARALLLDSDFTLETVAEMIGYSDPAYFARQFRQRVGTSPSAFRRRRT